MNPKDYEDYQKNNVKASKSAIKDYIQIYADMVKKLKNEDAIELEAVKDNIRKAAEQVLGATYKLGPYSAEKQTKANDPLLSLADKLKNLDLN